MEGGPRLAALARPRDHRRHEVVRDGGGVDITDEGAVGTRPPDGGGAGGLAGGRGQLGLLGLHDGEVGGGEGLGDGDGGGPRPGPAVRVEDGAGQRVGRGAGRHPHLPPGGLGPGHGPRHGRGGGRREHGGGVVADQLGGGPRPRPLPRLLAHQRHEVGEGVVAGLGGAAGRGLVILHRGLGLGVLGRGRGVVGGGGDPCSDQ